MMKRKYNAFFFDFDGVIADSIDVKTKAFSKLFESFGIDVQKKVVSHHLANGGMSRFEKFRYYYRNFLERPLSEEDLSELCVKFTDLVVEKVVAASSIAGVDEYLAKCYKLAPCFIVSATPEMEIIEIVTRRGQNRFFQAVLGAPARKEDNLQTLLDKYSLDPACCIFFGDAESDYLAAKKCGVNFHGIVSENSEALLAKYPQMDWSPNFLNLRNC